MTGHRRLSRGIAIVTAAWLIAIVAALAMATAGPGVAAAQQGCRRAGSPSGSASPSASASETEEPFPPTGLPSGIPPNPGADENAPPAANGLDPYDEVPVNAQDTTCKSTITIAYRSTGRAAFKGKVGSGEPMCKRARKVQVKKIKKGTDPTVARAATNAKGAYTAPEPNAKGKYYAVVGKSKVTNEGGDTVTCQAAKSEAIRV